MATPITSVDMFNILRQKIGEQEEKTLTEYVASEVEQRLDVRCLTLASKKDVAEVSADVASLRQDMSANASLLRKEISDSKMDTIKWMVSLFVTLALMIIGLYFRH